MSDSSIDLTRLANLLDFKSVSELEKWLIDLDIRNLQINWEENKLVINDDVIHGIKRTLRRKN